MPEIKPCILCGTSAQSEGLGPLDQQLSFTCPICGHYRATDRLIGEMPSIESNHLLSGYIREMNDNGKTIY